MNGPDVPNLRQIVLLTNTNQPRSYNTTNTGLNSLTNGLLSDPFIISNHPSVSSVFISSFSTTDYLAGLFLGRTFLSPYRNLATNSQLNSGFESPSTAVLFHQDRFVIHFQSTLLHSSTLLNTKSFNAQSSQEKRKKLFKAVFERKTFPSFKKKK